MLSKGYNKHFCDAIPDLEFLNAELSFYERNNVVEVFVFRIFTQSGGINKL